MSITGGDGRPPALGLVVQARPALFLETLTGALGSAGHQVRAAVPDPAEAARLVTRVAPDLCILHDLDPVECVQAARTVRDRAPAVKLLVLSTGQVPRTLRAYDEHVVDAVVGEVCDFLSLGAVLSRVARGERYLAIGTRPPAADGRPGPALTPRELQVLEHLVRGATTQVIAEELAISPHTVRSHVQGLSRKLGAHGRGRAVRAALTRHLVEAHH